MSEQQPMKTANAPAYEPPLIVELPIDTQALDYAIAHASFASNIHERFVLELKRAYLDGVLAGLKLAQESVAKLEAKGAKAP